MNVELRSSLSRQYVAIVGLKDKGHKKQQHGAIKSGIFTQNLPYKSKYIFNHLKVS